uniref:Cytochrome P450 3A24 n=1 Tax=Aceria tosichella TaxID=561515 RepID=A0A6G1SGH8_9ACAR
MEIAAQDPTTISYTGFIISLIVIVSLYHYYINVYNYFRRRGVRGPVPYPLVGNLPTILLNDRMKLEREWTKRYGKFYGVFFGTRASFIVNDAEVLREICLENFDAMPNHDATDELMMSDYQKDFLMSAQDDHWKRLRALQSATLTSEKIKRLFRLIDECTNDLVVCFSGYLDKGKQQLTETIVNLNEIYSQYTMDAITNAACAIKLDLCCKSKIVGGFKVTSYNSLTVTLVKLFNIPRLFVLFALPKWLLKKIGFDRCPILHYQELDTRFRPIVRQRMESGRKSDDYLQILVDARLDDQIELNELDAKENHHAALSEARLNADKEQMINETVSLSSSSRQTNGNKSDDIDGTVIYQLVTKARLTEDEIVSSAIFLLSAGVETTAALLTNCTYALAFHQDIQQRLYEVIKSIAHIDKETGEHSFDYDKLTSCEYLDAVISETLRMLTPVIHHDRVVSRDYYVKRYNVQLRKGDTLQLAYYSIMNNPDYWPEPLKFYPERFMGDNKKRIVPGSYCPFGLGPRHCLGMRFSLTEAKLALAKALMKFKFKHAPGTSFPPECDPSISLNNLKNPRVELVSR